MFLMSIATLEKISSTNMLIFWDFFPNATRTWNGMKNAHGIGKWNWTETAHGLGSISHAFAWRCNNLNTCQSCHDYFVQNPNLILKYFVQQKLYIKQQQKKEGERRGQRCVLSFSGFFFGVYFSVPVCTNLKTNVWCGLPMRSTYMWDWLFRSSPIKVSSEFCLIAYSPTCHDPTSKRCIQYSPSIKEKYEHTRSKPFDHKQHLSTKLTED